MKVNIRITEDLQFPLDVNIEASSQRNYDDHANAFNSALLTKVVAKKILGTYVRDGDHTWFRRMTYSASQSLDSVMLLCFGAKGTDAVKVARSIDELSRSAQHFRQDVATFDVYKSSWNGTLGTQERFSARKKVSSMEFADEQEREQALKDIALIGGKRAYTNKKMAYEKTGGPQAYDIYSLMSSYVHMDPLCLLSDEMYSVETDDQSNGLLDLSLVTAATAVIRLMDVDNVVGELRLGEEIESIKHAVCSQMNIKAFD